MKMLVNVGQSTVEIPHHPFPIRDGHCGRFADVSRTFRGPKRSGNSPNPWKSLWVKSRLEVSCCQWRPRTTCCAPVENHTWHAGKFPMKNEGVMMCNGTIIYKWWMIGTSSISFLDFPKLETCENLSSGNFQLAMFDFPPEAISSCFMAFVVIPEFPVIP